MPDFLSFLGEVALRSSVILAAVFLLLFVMKRASASERHLLLLAGLLVVTLAPVGLLFSPKISWTIALPRQAETSETTQKMTAYFLSENKPSLPPAASSVAENKPSLLERITVANGLAALIAAGMLAQVLLLGRAAWLWRKVRHQAVPAHLPGAILERAQAFAGAKIIPPIFVSGQITVPLLAGWLRPAVLLPPAARAWPAQRLAMVLCHELAHFRRGDARILPLHWLLRILYWWHPLVWLALARLRRERENACDDLVLKQDFHATDYADLIVFTARQAQAVHGQAGTLAMASPSHLGERIRAILDPGRNRRPASRTTIFTGLLAAFALGWFFVAAQVQAEDQPVASGSTPATNAPKPQILLEFKLVQIDEKTYISHQKKIDAEVANSDLVSLINLSNNLQGVSLLGAPSVTTEDGLKTNVDIVREMPYVTQFDKDKDGKIVPSDFKTRDVGLSIEGTPTLTADKQYVRLKFKCKLSSFEGWKEIPTGGRLPIFDTASTETERLIGKRGDAVWIGGPGTTRAYLPDNGPLMKAILPKRILLLVTARPIPAEAQAVPIPSKVMVEISLKYFQISEKTYSQQTATMAGALALTDALDRGDLSYFRRLSDFNLLSEPAVLMKVGEQGVAEAIRTVSFPVKLVRDNNGRFIPSDSVRNRRVGIRTVLRPELLADGTISLSCFGEITNFEGWIKTNAQEEQPVFNTSRKNGKYLLATGKPFGIWIGTNAYQNRSMDMTQPNTGKDLPALAVKDAPPIRIGMIMTATLSSADGSPIPTH